MTFNAYRLYFGDNENVLKSNVPTVSHPCENTKKSLNNTFQISELYNTKVYLNKAAIFLKISHGIGTSYRNRAFRRYGYYLPPPFPFLYLLVKGGW